MLNYRNGKWNFFLNYSMNANKGFTDMYALRTLLIKKIVQTIECIA